MSTSTNPDIEIGLYDADTDTLIQVLQPGMAIDASLLSTSNLTVSARVISGSALGGKVASMVLSLNDDQPRTETVEAHSSLFGKNSGTFTGSSLPTGVNTMELALYSKKNANGQLLDTITLDFTISQPPYLNVIAARKDELPPLPDGYTAYAVTIPDSVTAIGAFAFAYVNLESVEISDSVTAIGRQAFSFTNLTKVTIPDSVTAIWDGAFFGYNRTEVRLLLDDSNIHIGRDAFPAGVTIIREATVDAGTYTLNRHTDEVATFTLEGTGTLAFSNPDDTPMLTVTGDADLKGGTLSFTDLPTSLGTYTLIDVADGGTLSIDAAVLNQAINDVDTFDGNGYDYNLLQQDNDLVLQVFSVIEGDDGNDILTGGQKAESLMGHRGADILFGNQGDDLLDGGRGSDVLVGGDGADTLIGGKGSDTFLFTSDQGIDIIKDFSNQDRIVIDASALGGVIVNPVYDSSTGELSVTRQTFDMQITYGQIGSISVPIATSVLVEEEDITLAVLENQSGFDVDTDVSIV